MFKINLSTPYPLYRIPVLTTQLIYAIIQLKEIIMEQKEMKRKLIWDDASNAFNWYAESLISDLDTEKYLDGK